MEVSNSPEVVKTCNKHGAYQARVILVAGKEIQLNRCPTCTEELDRILAETAREEAEARRKAYAAELWNRSGIPPRYRTAAIEGYEVTCPSQQQALNRMRWFVDTWPERREQGTSMILCGQPGTGKTHLACAVARHAIEAGVTVSYTTMADVTRSIRRTYDDGVKTSESEAIATFVSPGLLIIDEVGAASGSDHEKLMMFEIINKRYEQVKPTIVVSNLLGNDLKAFISERVLDRLRQGGGKLIQFDWQSYRK
jgi:DNA replication protein DnaC